MLDDIVGSLAEACPTLGQEDEQHATIFIVSRVAESVGEGGEPT